MSNAAMQKAIATRTLYRCQYRVVINGYIKWVEDHGTIQYAADGSPLRVIGLAQDITERKTAEEVLRTSEARLRSLVETLPDLVWLKDPDGIYLFCNPRFEALYGHTEAEIAGKTDYDIVDPVQADFFRAHDLAATAAGRPTMNEEELTFADDGHRELVQTIKTPIRDQDGKLIGILGVAKDITQLRQNEHELEAHRSHLEELVAHRTAALESANHRLSRNDQRFVRTTMNQKIHQLDEQKLLQMRIDEAVRLTDSKIGYLHFVNDDQETISLQTWSTQTLRECTAEHDDHYPISAAGVWTDSVRFRHPVMHNDYQKLTDRKGYPDGHAHLTRHISIPVIEDCKVRLLIGVGNKPSDYDQTDVEQLQLIGNDLWTMVMRRRAELALAAAKEAAEAAAKSKSTFLANMSHEIRTPLNGVLGLAQIGYRDNIGRPKAQETFSRILSSGKLLLTVINDILDFSKIEAGKLVIDQVPIDPARLADETLQGVAMLAAEKNLKLTVETNGLPSAVMGDRSELPRFFTTCCPTQSNLQNAARSA